MVDTSKLTLPRLLPWVRVTLAAVVIGVSYGFLRISVLLYYAFLAVFLAYSLVLAFGGKGQTGIRGLLALFADTIYFLIVASYGTEGLVALGAVFYLYLLGEALVFYGPVEVGVIAGTSGIFFAIFPGLRELEATVLVAGCVACGFAVHKRRERAGMDALQERTIVAEQAAEKAREVERQRIAADFHDGPLQSFISLQMRLEILRKMLERDFHAGMQDLRELQTLAQSQIRDIRVFLHSMRPVDVDGANLVATARRTAENFQKESGIPVTFVGSSTPVGLPQEMTSEVLQMIREALHNVQKHAGATRVAVAMEKTDRGLEISVDDNGHGFNFAGTYTLEELEMLKLGPASLKRRARSLNADLFLESRPGRGSGVRVRIPLS